MFYDKHRRGRHSPHGRHGFRGGWGDAEFPGARKLDSADLQLVILAFLAQRPAHGYELIKTIEEHSGGFYVPSPGVIYPALAYLGEIGHASVAQEGARKLYRITAEGQSHLASQRASVDAILDTLSRIGRRMDDVREAFAGIGDSDSGASDELHRARHAFKQALRSKHGCDPQEALRIAQILNRATAEILSK